MTDAARAIPTLTPRQAEVLYLVAMGCANGEIAGRLGLAEQTVRNHLWAIYAALGVRGRIEAVRAWYAHAAQPGGA